MDVDEAELEHPPAAQRPADAPLPDTQPGDAADEPAYKRVRLDWSPATAAGGDGPADAAAASGAVKSEGDGAAGAAAAGCGPAAAAGVGIASSAGEATDPPAVKPEPSADAGAELGADAAAATPPPADDADKPRAKHAEVKPTMGAYTLREEYLIKQEAEGEIAFKYVENDGSDQNMIYLTGLKNIFSKQLPNMPKEYICRLVFDRRHRSTALVKRNGAVIGGITYRAFHAQAFGEIAFCAVTSSEQVKGFGTRLMNHAKEHARTRDRLTHFLTYADNNAVGYFAKQGFTKEVTMDAERWKGFIKDYDGGTLMECIMNPKFCFTGFPDMIRAQRAALDAKIRTISNAHIIHAGLSHFKDTASDKTRVPLPIAEIPGVREAGWTPEQQAVGAARTLLVFKDGTVEATPESLQRFLALALKEMQRNDDAWPFREPVSKDEVPDYYQVIKDPMDLSTMEARLRRQGYYITLDIFVADFRRIVENCRIYNLPETIYNKLASKLEASFNNYMASHVISDGPLLPMPSPG